MTRASPTMAVLTVLTAAALTSAGCSGDGASASNPPPKDSSSAAAHEVPPIPRPLDTGLYEIAPCRLLSAVQLARVGVTKPGMTKPALPTGYKCQWDDDYGPGRYGLLSTTVITGTGGPAGLYARRSNFHVFEPRTIGGYPAVISMGTDLRTAGDCDISLLTSEQEYVLIQVTLTSGVNAPADYADPCPRVERIAGEVLTTIKAANGVT